jgi:SET domain-containing protein
VTEPELRPSSGLCVRESKGRGRGVFAARAFRAGELLERAPVLVVPRTEVVPLRGTLLDDYWFAWDAQHIACGLGWASLYNHACPANATFHCETASRTIDFTAVRDIAVGDEVTINYHGVPDAAEPVWFPTV